MVGLLTTGHAVISPCGAYRYRLSRTWDGTILPLAWIMLNPSTADADQDDPTIRRCVSFSEREGAGGIEVLNLFALRATDPRELKSHPDPVGPDNDRWIAEVLHPHSKVVAAWGEGGKLHDRGARVLQNLRRSGIRVLCLGDKPRHPLYTRGDQSLMELPK